MSKQCELQKEYYQRHGNYKANGNGKYSDDYVAWLENQVLSFREVLSSYLREDLPNDECVEACRYYCTNEDSIKPDCVDD